jgi:hypothetical protein
MSPSYVRSLSRQIREYLANGFGATNHSVVLFARAGKTSVGLYIGKGLQNEGTGYFALTSFEAPLRLLPKVLEPWPCSSASLETMAITYLALWRPAIQLLNLFKRHFSHGPMQNACLLAIPQTLLVLLTSPPPWCSICHKHRPQIRLSRPSPRQALPPT